MAFDGDRKKKQEPPRLGIVTSTDDPEGLGRVQFRVPGWSEPPSPWAFGAGSNGKDRGLFMVPRVGAFVLLLWVNGDAEGTVFYFPVGWSLTGVDTDDENPTGSEVPPEARLTAKPEDVAVLSTESFAVELNETPGARVAAIRARGAPDMFLEIRPETNEVFINGMTSIQIQAVGQIRINAPNVIINGRTVKSGDGDI